MGKTEKAEVFSDIEKEGERIGCAGKKKKLGLSASMTTGRDLKEKEMIFSARGKGDKEKIHSKGKSPRRNPRN